MTIEEAKEIFLNRGYIQVEGGRIYDGDKWRESVFVISKWLEQEPCDDTISRQEAINKMQELEDEDIKAYGCKIPEGFDGKRAIEALKTLQPVTPKQNEWIPVDERLPENCDDVLVWIEYIKDDYNCAWWALAYYSLRYKKWFVSMNENNLLVKVKAWMPLPKPYTAESEDT